MVIHSMKTSYFVHFVDDSGQRGGSGGGFLWQQNKNNKWRFYNFYIGTLHTDLIEDVETRHSAW